MLSLNNIAATVGSLHCRPFRLLCVLAMLAMLKSVSAAKSCRLSYKQLPRLSGYYSVNGSEVDTNLEKVKTYSYQKFSASAKNPYVVIKTQETNEDGDIVTITGAWQPLTDERGRFMSYQFVGVDADEEDDRYFITPTKLSSSCRVKEFIMTVFHELDDLCETDADRQGSGAGCSQVANVHNVGQYYGKLKN